MDENRPLSPERDPRVYLAAERTFLAWIRTGLSMMGFGFVVARFGLFLQELEKSERAAPIPHLRGSLWFGVGLVLMGVAVNVIATLQHVRTFAQLRNGTAQVNRPALLGIVVALTLAAVGAFAAVYLLLRP